MMDAAPTNVDFPVLNQPDLLAQPSETPSESPGLLPQRILLQAVVVSLTRTAGPFLHPSMLQHLLRRTGSELGRYYRLQTEPLPPFQPDDLRKAVLACVEAIGTQWGGRHQILENSEARIELAVLDCPFESHNGGDMHVCGLYAGMLGEVAGDQLEYANVFLTPCEEPYGQNGAAGTSAMCHLTVHLDPTAESPEKAPDNPSIQIAAYAQDQDTLLRAAARGNSIMPLDRLSRREWDVLRLIGEGLTDKEIAAALKMSVRTAENHASRIYAKLRIRGRARLIRFALRHQVVGL